MKITEKKYLCTDSGERYTPLGAVSCGDTVRFELCLPPGNLAEKAVLRIHRDADGEMMLFPMREYGGNRFSAVISMKQLCGDAPDGLFCYVYDVYCPDGCITCGGEEEETLIPCGETEKRQLLVCRSDAHFPAWPRGGIIYHVFVDRFFSSGRARPKPGTVMNPDWENGIPQYAVRPGDDLPNNEFFGGDLFGIAEKMAYIASLGVTCLYLSPIFEAASNHKYDTGDYGSVDGMFGGEEGLQALLSAADAYGIWVILDGVFNHTGADSLYFNKYGRYDTVGAFQSAASPYYSWYTFPSHPDAYESWWGIPILPKVRGDAPGFREYILGEGGIVAKWMKKGIAGWRLDVADELSDGFLDALYSRVTAENPEAILYGEVWEDATDKIAYGNRRRYLRGGQIHSVMNYPLREAVIAYIRDGDAVRFQQTVGRIYRRYPKGAADLLMNHLGTHDTARILTVLAGDPPEGFTNAELAVKRLTKAQRARGIQLLKLAYTLICAMPGLPCIFYGDEAGTEGYGDPFCRRPYPWGREDESLLAHYRKIGEVHRLEDVFRDGYLRILAVLPTHLALIRENGRDPAVLLLLNRSDCGITVPLTDVVFGIDSSYEGDTPAVPPMTARFYHAADGIGIAEEK